MSATRVVVLRPDAAGVGAGLQGQGPAPSSQTVHLPPGTYYTTDGSAPTARSARATGPLRLARTTALRYTTDPDDIRQARGRTVLLNETYSPLLTLSLAIDPWRLFNPRTGWFREGPNVASGDWRKAGANFWTHAEHPAYAELLNAQGERVYGGTLGFRVFGGMSRLHAQKSFSLSARRKYGDNRIRLPVFGPGGPRAFKYLVARNAGSDWGKAHLRDGVLTGLLQDDSWELDTQASRPVRVFLNGRYWGIYHLREKINVHFLAERFGIEEKKDIDLLEGQGGAKKGSRKDYDALRRYIRERDLADGEAYREVVRKMDVDNFQRVQIAQIYFDNQDAGGNLRYWRNRTDPHSRWRWILYDVDQGFGLHSDTAYARNTLELLTAPNGPAWPNPAWSTYLSRKLLRNDTYRRRFVNRTLDYLQTDFAPATVQRQIEAAAGQIAPEISQHTDRWGLSLRTWNHHLERMKTFAARRPAHVREHYRQKFAGGPDRQVRIEPGAGGFVVLNDNLTLTESYTGRYFANIPVEVLAVADEGYYFAGWEDGAAAGERIVGLSQDRIYTLRPRFLPQAETPGTVATAPTPTSISAPPGPEPAAAAGRGLTMREKAERVVVGVFVLFGVGLFASLRGEGA